MPSFKTLKANNELKEIIKSAFDAELDISGDWGYAKEDATVLHSIDIPLAQAQHALASIRSYIEMNMTLPKEERYGSINVNERERTQEKEETKIYDKVVYEVTAMREDVYEEFINEYKKGYGTVDFDMSAHFDARKKATITREIIYWFEVSQTL